VWPILECDRAVALSIHLLKRAKMKVEGVIKSQSLRITCDHPMGTASSPAKLTGAVPVRFGMWGTCFPCFTLLWARSRWAQSRFDIY
jgi:hypothetical protein